ncbi:GAP family protein [soil metagenome]
MWITLLAMAVAVSLEPFRIAMTVVMINRPRPILQLLVFLTGGFAMGIAVGMIALFVLRPALGGSAHFTLPTVQIVVGTVLLVSAAVLATGLFGKRGDGAVSHPDRAPGLLATRTRQLLNGQSLWVAGVAGLGIALPSIDFLAALALIAASGAAATVQFEALLLFNVVAFGFVELPLLCYLVAPDRTLTMLSALQDWVRTRRSRSVAILLAAVGCVLVIAGLIGL